MENVLVVETQICSLLFVCYCLHDVRECESGANSGVLKGGYWMRTHSLAVVHNAHRMQQKMPPSPLKI